MSRSGGMQIFVFFFVVALTRWIDLAIALPHANTALLGPRGPSLTNPLDDRQRSNSSPPNTHAFIAATKNPTIQSLPPRTDDNSRITWHDSVYGSRTYITIAPGTPLPKPQIMSVVIGARTQIQVLGTGVLVVDRRTGWACHAVGIDGLVLDVQHANNHQVTRGVLLAALDALVDYMATRDAWAEVEFKVYDGRNWVGVVTIGW